MAGVTGKLLCMETLKTLDDEGVVTSMRACGGTMRKVLDRTGKVLGYSCGRNGRHHLGVHRCESCGEDFLRQSGRRQICEECKAASRLAYRAERDKGPRPDR